MEYHQECFEDASILIWKGQQLMALFPANRREKMIYSHQGLSYGGFLFSPKITAELAVEVFRAAFEFYRQQGFQHIIYKQLPHYYYKEPAFEEEYPLFLLEAQLISKETSAVIDLANPKTYQTRRKRRIKLVQKSGLEVQLKQEGLADFWPILSHNLQQQHQLQPVHSLEEIQNLANHFPKNIQLYLAQIEQQAIAGILIFNTWPTVHAQYIAAHELGKQLGALDLLIDGLIDRYAPSHRYFSLGVSDLRQSKQVNRGLKEWKAGFGAFDFPHNTYQIDLDKVDTLKGRFV